MLPKVDNSGARECNYYVPTHLEATHPFKSDFLVDEHSLL